MRKKDLEELKKTKTPKQIIELHCNWKINLTDKQVDEMIKLKNENQK